MAPLLRSIRAAMPALALSGCAVVVPTDTAPTGQATLSQRAESEPAAALSPSATPPRATATPALSVRSVEPAPPTSPPPAKWTLHGEFTQGGYIKGIAPMGTVRAALGDTELDLAADGAFFAAFDRDSPSILSLTATMADDRTVTRTLAIEPREWPTQWVNVAKRSGGSSEAWWQKRKPEWEAIQAARARRTGANGWRQEFIWPVEARISSVFGSQRLYRGEPGNYHTGVDIAPGAGVPFVAPADGTVVLARTGFSLEGGIVIVDHGQGLNSAFLHMARIAVEEGQPVAQSDLIGTVGSTGRSTGPHLHWSLKWKDARLDPVLLAGPMPSRSGD